MLTRMRTAINLTIGLLCIAGALSATSLTVSRSDTETLFSNGDPAFRVVVGPGGQLQADNTAWLTSNVFSSDYAFELSYTVPAGSTINSATLDLTGFAPVFGLLNVTPEAGFQDGPNKNKTPVFDLSYSPVFSAGSSALFVTITAGSVSRTIDVQSLPGYNLIANGFAGELAAGTPLTIDWSQTLTLSASTANFSRNDSKWLNAYRDYSVSGSVQSTATAQLTLDYTPAAAAGVPEPGTCALTLIGLGLVVIGCVKHRMR